MPLSAVDHRILKIIEQNIILSTHLREGDVIDVSTGKRVIPDHTTNRLIARGLAAWEWSEEYEEYRLVLTDAGISAIHDEGK